jgi:hypothetical protein
MLGRRFALEDNAFRVETVRDGVHGGCFAAGFGFGAVRFSAVGTGGIDFSSGRTLLHRSEFRGALFGGCGEGWVLDGKYGGKNLVGLVTELETPIRGTSALAMPRPTYRE